MHICTLLVCECSSVHTAFSAVVCVHLRNSFRLWDVAQTPPALSAAACGANIHRADIASPTSHPTLSGTPPPLDDTLPLSGGP